MSHLHLQPPRQAAPEGSPDPAARCPRGWPTLGRYEVHQRIASGRMGRVFLGYDPARRRRVAIKVARPPHPDRREDCRAGRHRLFGELRAALRLSHPHIIAVYDAGTSGRNHYLVMEYVGGGRTLADFTRPGRLLPLPEVQRLVLQCADALGHAHRQGIVHRDVKPGNILVTADGDVKVADFGIASILDRQGCERGGGQGVIGSPQYMSPEQMADGPLTEQTDVYSLGAVLYELLVGCPPFAAGQAARLYRDVLYRQPVAAERLRPALPEALCRVLERAMAKSTSARYGSAAEFRAALARLQLEREEAAVGCGRNILAACDPRRLVGAAADGCRQLVTCGTVGRLGALA